MVGMYKKAKQSKRMRERKRWQEREPTEWNKKIYIWCSTLPSYKIVWYNACERAQQSHSLCDFKRVRCTHTYKHIQQIFVVVEFFDVINGIVVVWKFVHLRSATLKIFDLLGASNVYACLYTQTLSKKQLIFSDRMSLQASESERERKRK